MEDRMWGVKAPNVLPRHLPSEWSQVHEACIIPMLNCSQQAYIKFIPNRLEKPKIAKKLF